MPGQTRTDTALVLSQMPPAIGLPAQILRGRRFSPPRPDAHTAYSLGAQCCHQTQTGRYSSRPPMVPQDGIKPSFQPYQDRVLSLNYCGDCYPLQIGAGWRNRTPAPCLQGKTSATKDKPALVLTVGFEPTTFRLRCDCTTVVLRQHFASLFTAETGPFGPPISERPYAKGAPSCSYSIRFVARRKPLRALFWFPGVWVAALGHFASSAFVGAEGRPQRVIWVVAALQGVSYRSYSGTQTTASSSSDLLGRRLYATWS